MSWRIVECNGVRHRLAVVHTARGVWIGWPGRAELFVTKDNNVADSGDDDSVRAPMTGTVVTVAAECGAAVSKGDVLVVLEAMKMEYRLTAPHDGTVDAIHCVEGELVDLGASLVTLNR